MSPQCSVQARAKSLPQLGRRQQVVEARLNLRSSRSSQEKTQKLSDKRRGAVRRALTALTTTRLLSLEPAVIFLAGSRRVAVAMLHLRGGERLNEPLFMTMVHGPGVGRRSPLPGY
ncbi:hypothetical protein SRHO_G00325890 [Serrasalmus rhombeus]